MNTATADSLIEGIVGDLVGLFEQMDWAEQEIFKARERHPEHRDLIYHGFSLLLPTSELMSTQFVYRSHCRELLDRLVAGGDTREATNAEIAIACSAISQVAPMRPSGVLVYMRAWLAAFPGHAHVFDGTIDSYEVVAGQESNDLLEDIQRKLRKPDRTVGEIDCSGMHHGQRVGCRFRAKAAA